MNDIPVTREHQQWRNFKASEYVREIDERSRQLQDIVASGAKLSRVDRDHAQLLSDRIRKIVEGSGG